MRWILTTLLLVLTTCHPVHAAILVFGGNGAFTVKSTLIAAATDADTAGKTVVVTTVLSAVQSNISTATTHGVWPSNRTLRVEQGGVLAPTTKFTGLPESRPEWFGTDSTGAAIQKAIDAVTNGTVYLSDTTYILNRRVPMTQVGGAPPCNAMLVPKTGVNIIGTGYNSVLKVADSFSTGGDYVVFGTHALEATDNIQFKNFRIDGNGLNNLHPGGGAIRRAMGIWLFSANNVQIEGMWFDNNPGLNTIKLGSDSMSYRGIDCQIRGNRFYKQGPAVVGNRNQPDHSTIYVSGDNVKISGNSFIAADSPFDSVNIAPGAVASAIEMHGLNMQATGNYVKNYSNIGFSLNDGITGGKNHLWQGNVFENITNTGIQLESVDDTSDITIANNQFIVVVGGIANFTAAILQSVLAPDTTKPINGLSITGNIIRGLDLASTTSSNGIFLSAVQNVTIANNTIENISSSGIRIYDVSVGENANAAVLQNRIISITGNTLSNCNFFQTTFAGIALDSTAGSTTMDGVRVTGNQIEHAPFLLAARPTNITTDAAFMTGFTYDPASIAALGYVVGVATAIIGAKVGDTAIVTPPYSLQGLVLTAYVISDNTVNFVLYNPTGAPIDLASGTWKVRVNK